MGARYPENVEAVLIVELDGSVENVTAERNQLDTLLAQSQATEVLIAATAEERAKIWKGRKSVFSAVGRLSPDFIVQDGVVPRGKLGFALENIQKMSDEAGIKVANVFHAGDGNLHPLIMFDGRKPGELHRAEEAGRADRSAVRRLRWFHYGRTWGWYGKTAVPAEHVLSRFA